MKRLFNSSLRKVDGISFLRRAGLGLAVLPPALFLLIFLYLPLISIFVSAFAPTSTGSAPMEAAAPLNAAYIASIFGFTVFQAAASTLLSLALGLPGAWLIARRSFSGKKLFTALSTIPFVLPSILVVLGFTLFFGDNGYFNRFLSLLTGIETPVIRILYSLPAILLAHAFYNFPLVARITGNAWEGIPPSVKEAAQSLGARSFRLFRTLLPAYFPGAAAAGLLVFLYCFTSFSVVLVLGGGPRFTTLGVEIYRLARISLDVRSACLLATIEIAFTFLVLLLYRAMSSVAARRSHNPSVAGAAVTLPRLRLSSAPGIASTLYLILCVIVLLGPLAAVVVRSFQDRSGWSGELQLSLRWYMELFSLSSPYARTAVLSIARSVLIAFMTVALTLPLSMLAASAFRKKRAVAFTRASSVPSPAGFLKQGTELLFLLPMGISGVLLGLVLRLWLAPLGGHSAFFLFAVALAHTIIAFPLAFGTLRASLERSSPDLDEASESLGATPLVTFIRVRLPAILPALGSAGCFSFALSFGEFNAGLMLSPSAEPTLSVALYRFIASYQYSAACVLGTVLIVVCAAAFAVMGIERRKKP